MTRFTPLSIARTTLAAAVSAGALAAPALADCVSVRDVHGYSVIDDRHLVLNSGVNRHYLVTTRQQCRGLRYGVRVATSIDGPRTICSPSFEYVMPNDGMRCGVDMIEEVESVDAAEQIVAERIAAGEAGREARSGGAE